MRAPAPWKRSHAAVATLLGGFSLAVLLGCRVAQQAADGLAYGVSATQGVNMFHPHHLLYTPIVRLFLLAAQTMSSSADAVLAAQVHNSLWAAVAVVCIYLLASRLLDSQVLGLLVAGILLFSYGFWTSATQIGVYVPSAGSLMLASVILLQGKDTALSPRSMILISGAFAMAVFYHQMNVLFAIPLGCYLITGQRGQRLKALSIVLGLAAVIVLGVYCAAFLSTGRERSAPEFVHFALSYALHPNPKWGTVDNISVEGGWQLLKSLLNTFAAFPRQGRPVLALFGLSTLLVWVWSVAQVLRHSDHRTVRFFLVLWVTTYVAFLLWWFPSYEDIFVLPGLALVLLFVLFVMDVARRIDRRPSRFVLIILTIAAFAVPAVNARAFINMHKSKGKAHERAALLASVASRCGDRCVIFADWAVAQNLRYFFGQARVLEYKLPLAYFYQHIPLPEEYHLSADEHIVIPAPPLIPESRESGFDGYENPREWLQFAGWLFDFGFDEGHRLSSCRDFEVTTGVGETAYLVLSASRIDVDGLEGLFRELDRQLEDRHVGPKDPFQSWLHRTLSRPISNQRK